MSERRTVNLGLLGVLLLLGGMTGLVWAPAPVAADVIISEICDPLNNFAVDRYVEIYNTGLESVDLDGWYIYVIENDVYTARTIPLSGFIHPGQALVAGIVGNSYATWTTAAAWTSMTGDPGDGARLMDASGDTVDWVIADPDFTDKNLVRNSGVVSSSPWNYTAGDWTATAVTDIAVGASTPGAHTCDYPAQFTASTRLFGADVAAGDLFHGSSDSNTVMAGRMDSGPLIIEIIVDIAPGSTANAGDIPYLMLWRDVDQDTQWSIGDVAVGSIPWNATLGCYTMSGSTWDQSAFSNWNFVLTAGLADTAVLTDGETFAVEMRGDSDGINTNGNSDSGFLIDHEGGTADDDQWLPAHTWTNGFFKTIDLGSANPGDIIFTEVMWGAANEWVELYNRTDNGINLQGWTFSDGEDTFTFGNVVIAANDYFLLEDGEAATSVASDADYSAEASLTLANGPPADNLFLASDDLVWIDSLNFSPGSWPAGDNVGGLVDGVSMERRNLDIAIAGDTRGNWLDGPYTVACGAVGGVSGTPGQENSMAYWDSLTVNEVCFDDVNSPDQNDWIEVYNASDTPINVYNWEVTDFDASGDFTLPQVAIPGKGFIVCHYGTGTDETAFGSPISVLNVFNANGNALAASADQAAIFTDAAHDTYAIIDFVAWAQTPGTDEVDAWLAAQTGEWPATTVQIDIVNSNNVGRSICRVTDGGDSNTSDTSDWRELANTEINFFSEGGTNKSNLAGTLTGVTEIKVLATNTDLVDGYSGASGDSAWIRLTGTDNDAADTNTTTCTVVASLSDAVGIVLTLRETGLATGIFEGYLYLRGNTNDAIEWITVQTGDVVTITSIDAITFYDTIVIGQASGIGGIVINEFLADVGATSETEFIELYNTTAGDISIAGCYLDDISGGGSAPYQIPTTGTSADTIPAYGFRTYWGLTTGISLGNSGDDVRFLDTDNNTVISSRTYVSPTNDVSEGREYDGGANWVYFDGVNDPNVTPDSTNNPGPYISTLGLASDVPDSFYFDGVVDTSIIGGSILASCTAWFSNAGAQNVTITVYGLYTYDNSVCTGSAAFGDAIQTAGEASSPYTVTYSIEAGLGSQDVTIFLRDNVYANDSLTIHFEEDHTPPQVEFIANTNLTTGYVGTFFDTIQVTDSGAGYNQNLADTPAQRWWWGFSGEWSETDACDSGSQVGLASFQYYDDTVNDWSTHSGETLYWQVRVKDAVGNWTVTDTDVFGCQELVDGGNNLPTVVIGVPADGDTYAGDLSCSFVISDADNDSCWLSLEVSFDSGATWFSPTIVGSLGPLNASAGGTATIVTWQSATDYGGMSCTFVMRASVRDGTDTGTGDTTYHFGIDNLAPAAPTGLWAAGDTAAPDTGVYLTWNHVVSTDTAGYYVYGDTDADGNWQRVSGLLTDTNAAWWSILNPGDTWVFAVVSVDAAGNESGHSDTATAPLFIFDKYAASCLLGGAAALPVPGATLEWRLRVLDNGFGPGDSVTIEDTVYVGTVYKAGSAAVVAGSGYTAIITYSHDSGATWDDQETAPVTNIRWSLIEWLATGSLLEVKYEAYLP